MKILLSTLPVALLVAYSQIIVKWRLNHPDFIQLAEQAGLSERLVRYLTDPFIISAYVSALLGSFAWVFVVSRHPLAIAFPVYMSLIFILVTVISVLLLHETLTPVRILAIGLILAGITLLGANQ